MLVHLEGKGWSGDCYCCCTQLKALLFLLLTIADLYRKLNDENWYLTTKERAFSTTEVGNDHDPR